MAAEPREADEIITGADGALDLPPKQELAVRAVVSHPTLKEAARAAGISETTLWRYMQSEAFSRRVREARREAINHTITRLQAASGDAVTVLQELMLTKEAPASARIAAARTVLDYAMNAGEIQELRSRVEELEEFIRLKQEQEDAEAAETEVEG